MSGLLLIAASCVAPPAPVVVPPIPPGQARVWFYRPYEPSETFNLARIETNGGYVGAVENGAAFYRDVPPGHYHIEPESFGRDVMSTKTKTSISPPASRSTSRSSLWIVGG